MSTKNNKSKNTKRPVSKKVIDKWLTYAGIGALVVLVLAVAFAISYNDIKEEENNAQLANPITTVNSAEEMAAMLGYTVPELNKPAKLYTVLSLDGDPYSGRIIYEDGASFNITEGSGDISGIYGAEATGTEEIGGCTVTFSTLGNTEYASWQVGEFALSLTSGSEGDLKAEVAEIITAMEG